MIGQFFASNWMDLVQAGLLIGGWNLHHSVKPPHQQLQGEKLVLIHPNKRFFGDFKVEDFLPKRRLTWKGEE
jgi:hypothetical protein